MFSEQACLITPLSGCLHVLLYLLKLFFTFLFLYFVTSQCVKLTKVHNTQLQKLYQQA